MFLDGRCSELCTRHYNPMCGNDGKTYGNECTFNAAKCISKGELRLAKVGECGMLNLYVHFSMRRVVRITAYGPVSFLHFLSTEDRG